MLMLKSLIHVLYVLNPKPLDCSQQVKSSTSTAMTLGEGYITILVGVNRFSKGCCLIPLPGLLPAYLTAEALFHPFRLHEDIVRDGGQTSHPMCDKYS